MLQEQHKSVEVMESNLLCSILVLMFTVPKKTPLLCTLEYTDHTRCLPTQVHLNCEGKVIAHSDEHRIVLYIFPLVVM